MTDPIARLSAALADRYRLERELGAGGMATVYLAHDLRHDRPVAIKVLRPELAAVIGAERFLAEIKTTANLQHPHILPLHDSGEVDGTVFYVMPLVEGESLRDRLARERQLPIADAVRITVEIAGALDYAHRHHVIHRDIKPENILLHDGRALVADFGIALAASRSEGGTRMTETGMSLGTPHYMSPEQAMGERDLDARTDVYALGCVLYEMLTGEPPFNGPSAQAIVAKVMTEKPTAPTATRDTVPEAVEDAVLTALAKLPVDRFTSAAEFAAALEGRATGSSRPRPRTVAPATPAASLRAWGGWGLAAVAVIAAAWGWTRGSEEPVTRLVVGALPGQELDITIDGTHLAVSPDGKVLVYTVGDSTGTQLWVKRREDLAATLIPGTEGAFDPFISPDGSTVGFFKERGGRGMYTVSLAGGLPKVVTREAQLGLSGGTWATDGYIYFDADVGGLKRIRPDGTGLEVVLPLDTTDADRPEIGIAWPQVLPGNKVALVRIRRAGDPPADFDILALRIGSGERRIVVRAVSARYHDGFLVYVTADGTLQAARFDEKRMEVTGQPVVIASGVRVGGTYAGVDLAVSEDGTIHYVTGPAGLGATLGWVGSDGVVVPADSTWVEAGFIRGFALSPDGTRAALTLFRLDVVESDIWIKQLPTGPLTRVTIDPGADFLPSWSADGRYVYFSSNRLGTIALFRHRADGLGADSLVIRADSNLFLAEESPDGRWILTTMETGSGDADIVALRKGSDTVPVSLIATPATEHTPTLSPDGRWLAHVSTTSGQNQIVVRPFPDVNDGLWQVSLTGGDNPRWAHSGKALFFSNPATGEILGVDVVTTPTFQASQPRVVSRGTGASAQFLDSGFDVAPDDRRFLIVAPAASNAGASLIRIENTGSLLP